MRAMLKIIMLLSLVFASTFLLLNQTGLLGLDRIVYWLEQIKSAPPVIVGTVVALLLFADLFIAMPTLTIMLLSGYFLGPVVGAGFSIAGLTLAGLSGYALSYRYGDHLLSVVMKDEAERAKAVETYQQHGVAMILLSRAAPILPEVSACMAGLSRMRFGHFITAWLFSTVPYAIIAAYAGSISSASNPQPAIYTAIALTVFFWAGWFLFRKHAAQTQSTPPDPNGCCQRQ